MKALLFSCCLLSVLIVGYSNKSGWTCESDGYYYQNGVKSQYVCSKGTDKSSSDKSSSDKSSSDKSSSDKSSSDKSSNDKSSSDASTSGDFITNSSTSNSSTSNSSTSNSSTSNISTNDNSNDNSTNVNFTSDNIKSDTSKSDKGSWSCGSDGYYYQNGIKSQYTCISKSGKDDAKQSCTRSEDPAMPSAYTKTCIKGPPDNDLRCWWTFVPDTVKTSNPSIKVPLMVDMHGGDGCASHQALSSGYADLAKSLPATDSFIVVWPQGYDKMWGTCGADCDKAQQDQDKEKAGKKVHSVDDINFLSSMISYIVQSSSANNPAKDLVDSERIFSTGFSMGCMMSHRLALERSSIIAGFAGHGGTLIQLGNDLNVEKKRFLLQPMPSYTTGGTDDTWFEMAKTVHKSWSTLNECTASEPVSVVSLPDRKLSVALQYVNSSCKNNVEVVRLEIVDGIHVQDNRMAKLSYDFLKRFTRPGSRDALPPAPDEVDPVPAEDEMNAGDATGDRSIVVAAFTSTVLSIIVSSL